MGTLLQEIPEDSEEDKTSPVKELSPYQKLLQAVCDSKFSHEVALEKRVGLYKFCGDIGRGNFSRVKKAVHLLTKGKSLPILIKFVAKLTPFRPFPPDKVAIKIVDRSRLDTKNLRMLSREVATLEFVQHPYIIRLFEVVETLGRVHLVTEFIQGGELYYKIVQNGVFPENKAAKIFKQLALAIQHMVRIWDDFKCGKWERKFFSSTASPRLCPPRRES
jgi:serine/threonine protein kinase